MTSVWSSRPRCLRSRSSAAQGRSVSRQFWRRSRTRPPSWDQHGGLVRDLRQNCRDTDRPCAALLRDLKQRGLLDQTLVIWGGEFGRTPMVQGGNDGRDHHPNCFSMWLAGGGVKPGITIGESDDFGFNAIKDRVHVHDMHATILHLLGFDHTRLTYRFQGRDFRLTDVHGSVVKELLA